MPRPLTALELSSTSGSVLPSPLSVADCEALGQRLEQAVARHNVRWHWVRGHAGDELNERADALARSGIEAVRAGARSGGSA